MLEDREEMEGLALRLRLGYEMGVTTGEELRKEASKWSPDERNEMRRLFKEAVSSVSPLNGPQN